MTFFDVLGANKGFTPVKMVHLEGDVIFLLFLSFPFLSYPEVQGTWKVSLPVILVTVLGLNCVSRVSFLLKIQIRGNGGRAC